MNRVSELDDKQVAELWKQWVTERSSESREALIHHYLSLVDFLASKLARSVPVSVRPDLWAFGAIGLIDAIEKFRPEMGNRFETYGSCRIRGAMGDGLRALDWLPRGAGTRASRVIEKIVPVDFQTARNRVGIKWDDCLPDPDGGNVSDALELQADHEEVVDAVACLPARERMVVTEHYYKRRKLAEIGLDLGVTESRVCQLHRRALRLLQESLLERLSA